jgi:hypothetical protein
MLGEINSCAATGAGSVYLGVHRRAQCIRSDGCLRTAPLCNCQRSLAASSGDLRTVDIDVALLHELAQLRKALGGVNLGHVDGTQDGRGVESAGGKQRVFDGYMCAPQQAWEHVELMFGRHTPRLELQLRERSSHSRG